MESSSKSAAFALESWLQEKHTAYLYKIIAKKASTQQQKELFEELSVESNEQAELWANEVQKAGGSVPTSYHPTLRVRVVACLLKQFEPRTLRPILSAMKVRGMSVYSSADAGHPMPESVADIGARHKSASNGNNLRAAIFGVNDGLISNASLIMGMIGATSDNHIITLAGIAGLLAGAFSMAAGEFVSVRSQREMYEYQIGLEKKELELYPAEEAAELAMIYHARGLTREAASHIANTLIQDPVNALNTLAREELGLDPDSLVSPYGAALSSFVSFVIGAFIPLIPFIFAFPSQQMQYTILFTALSLFVIGAVISLYTGRSAFKSGLRMLVIGLVAGSVTYGIGHLLGMVMK
jgi:VIT1/CCC1 family predicted Fe2+/Mn2+ transporter